MRIIQSLEATGREIVLTIGSFDGIHRGHQYLLGQIICRAREAGRLSAALTFNPHPRVLLNPEQRTTYLSTLEERIAIMEALGLDLLILLPFTRELASTPPEIFVGQLYETLQMRELWVGPDFALGRGRSGNIAKLQEFAQSMGYTLHVVEPLREGQEIISSTRIRTLLQEGQIEMAAKLLGRPYIIAGQVVPGARRGRSLGFRTANIEIDPERATPRNGVYAVWAWVDQQRYQAVANVGVRPSFGDNDRLLEVHLMDYEGNLYGKHLMIEFVRWLRPELRFDDVGALVQQIGQDVLQAKALLSAEACSS